MGDTAHTIREDDRYTVIVGWEPELQTFYAYVFESPRRDGEPLLAVGETPHEVPTISQLASAVGRFARLEPKMISTLRHDAAPLPGETEPAYGFE